MKKLATGLLVLTAAAALAVPATATTLMSESFSYANGNLVPNGSWATYSGAATDVQVTSGRAVGYGPNANDDHKLFTAQPLTTKTYACMEVVIPDPGGAPKPIYFAELKDGGATLLVSRIYVLPITGGWTFGISFSSTSATQGVTPWSASTLTYGQNYKLVVNYDPVAKTSTLWVDPINESSTSVTNLGVAAAIAVSGFGLRQSATASTLPASPAYVGTADWSFSVDNVGVGTTFDDACYQYTPTKSSTWGQLKSIYR